MADEGAAQSASVWPLVRFQFSVCVDGNTDLLFQEVTGLNTEVTPIEYRAAGKNQAYTVIKMPGISKFSNVVLKKGSFTKDKNLWTKYSAIKMNTYKRMSIVISLLDESGEPAMSWTLTNAFPCKMIFADMKSDANEAAIETMELAHEGITLSLPS